MESDYDHYVAGLYDRKLNEKEQLILRVTRMFGECDVAAPPDYIGEVMRYIAKWQSTGRFSRDGEARAGCWVLRQRSPRLSWHRICRRSIFYLAMQESDFDPYASGPPTRWGIAKGMWQFIPDTGTRFGLKIGPLAAQSRRRSVRRSAQLGEGDAGGGEIHQGYLLDGRAGVRAAGDGLVQLGRVSRHRSAAADARQPARAQFLEAARAVSGQSAASRPTTTSSTSSRRQSSARTRGFSDFLSTVRWRSRRNSDPPFTESHLARMLQPWRTTDWQLISPPSFTDSGWRVFVFHRTRVLYQNEAAVKLRGRLQKEYQADLIVMLRDHLFRMRELDPTGDPPPAVTLLTDARGEPLYVHVLPFGSSARSGHRGKRSGARNRKGGFRPSIWSLSAGSGGRRTGSPGLYQPRHRLHPGYRADNHETAPYPDLRQDRSGSPDAAGEPARLNNPAKPGPASPCRRQYYQSSIGPSRTER